MNWMVNPVFLNLASLDAFRPLFSGPFLFKPSRSPGGR